MFAQVMLGSLLINSVSSLFARTTHSRPVYTKDTIQSVPLKETNTQQQLRNSYHTTSTKHSCCKKEAVCQAPFECIADYVIVGAGAGGCVVLLDSLKQDIQ